MKGWRTVILNGLVALFGVAEAVLRDAPIDSSTLGYVLAGVGALNIFLRSITTTAVGKAS